MRHDQPLTPTSVLAFLRQSGVLASDEPAVAVALTGGVSNLAFLVRPPGLVVKQSLDRLDLAAVWHATRERTVTEANALRIARDLTPAAVPRVIHLDTADCILVIEAAPADWTVLKDELLAGRVDGELMSGLATVLATWHNATAANPALAARCDVPEAFKQLRTDPFHRTVMERHADLAPLIDECIRELEEPRMCLVHGDFSPKNILVGRDGFWVIDFEVAHIGNPVFDVAFLLTHLLLKAAHRPDFRGAYLNAATAFLGTYAALARPELQSAPDRLAAHVGCLLLARVDGRSPAGYLSPSEQVEVRDLGRRLLGNPVADVESMFELAT